jgi:hypothetical protein
VLFTFVAETGGTTSISQVVANGLLEAIARWNDEADIKIPLRDLFLSSPVPIRDRKNVWCVSGIREDDSAITAHVIATVEPVVKTATVDPVADGEEIGERRGDA